MYAKGEGVPQDTLPHTVFQSRRRQGDEEARKARDVLAAKMTVAQIAEAQRRAREWKPKTSP